MERNNNRSLWPPLLQFSSISIPSQFIQHFVLRRSEQFIPLLYETKQCFLNVRSNVWTGLDKRFRSFEELSGTQRMMQIVFSYRLSKVKGNVPPRTGHEGPEEE